MSGASAGTGGWATAAGVTKGSAGPCGGEERGARGSWAGSGGEGGRVNERKGRVIPSSCQLYSLLCTYYRVGESRSTGLQATDLPTGHDKPPRLLSRLGSFCGAPVCTLLGRRGLPKRW